jgi:hypothetical protein
MRIRNKNLTKSIRNSNNLKKILILKQITKEERMWAKYQERNKDKFIIDFFYLL